MLIYSISLKIVIYQFILEKATTGKVIVTVLWNSADFLVFCNESILAQTL